MVALESSSLALPFSFVITLQMVNEKGKRIDSSKRFYNFQLRIIGSSEIRVWRYSSKTTSDTWTEGTRSSRMPEHAKDLEKRV
jgi:hypothetical protein